MMIPRCEFGLCALGGTMYAIGGWIGEDIGDSIESYDPIRKTWETVDKLPEPRFSMGVVSHNFYFHFPIKKKSFLPHI